MEQRISSSALMGYGSQSDLLITARNYQKQLKGRCFLICSDSFKIKHRYRKETGALLSIQQIDPENPRATLAAIRKTAKLDSLLTVKELTGVVFLALLNLSSSWVSGFDPTRTKLRDFVQADGSIVQLPMMYQHTEVEIYQDEKTTAIRKDLTNGAQIEFMIGPVRQVVPYKKKNIRLQLPKFTLDYIQDLRSILPEDVLKHGYHQIHPEGFSPSIIRQRVRLELEEEGELVEPAPDEHSDYLCDCKQEKDPKVSFDHSFHFRITRGGLVIANGVYDGR